MRISFHEQDFLVRSEPWHPKYGVLYISFLISAGDDDAYREFSIRKLPYRTSDNVSSQAQLSDPRQRCNISINKPTEPEQSPRQQLSSVLSDCLKIGKVHYV